MFMIVPGFNHPKMLLYECNLMASLTNKDGYDC